MLDFDVILFDRNARFIEVTKRLFVGNMRVSHEVIDVRTIPKKGTAFVSPSNSLLFFDGGIDYVYSRKMFPCLERKARMMVKELCLKTALGRFYLPVGSSMVVQVEESTCVVCAPTMFLPHDVSSTRNAYHAFMAALCAFRKYRGVGDGGGVCRLACPALCTGYGKMSVEDAAQQMYEAYCDFERGVVPAEISHEDNMCFYITANKDDEQPNNYDNREIKTIDVRDVVYV